MADCINCRERLTGADQEAGICSVCGYALRAGVVPVEGGSDGPALHTVALALFLAGLFFGVIAVLMAFSAPAGAAVLAALADGLLIGAFFALLWAIHRRLGEAKATVSTPPEQ